METLREPTAFRAACDAARTAGKRVALVPTMGALHDGHMSLVNEANSVGDWVVVSIFVNPTQFGPNEDLDRYPRTLDDDCAKCNQAGVAAVFAPDATAMYPAGDESRVNVGATAEHLCGAFRPGHFEGVCTVVTKLFALTGACAAIFGRKDYQQLRVIERFTKDLLFPVEIIGAPIVREPDGLAMSSRNRFLSAEDRQRALTIAQALTVAVRDFASGERDPATLRNRAHERIAASAERVDYVTLTDPLTIQPIHSIADRALLAVAAHIGGTRLIDNVVLGEDPAPILNHV